MFTEFRFYSQFLDVSLSWGWSWQEALSSSFHVEGSAAEASIPRSKRPTARITADLAVCDCYEYCPLCGAKMNPYTPDLTPTTYDPEKGIAVLYVCNNHSPPYYSKQKPVEVHLS